MTLHLAVLKIVHGLRGFKPVAIQPVTRWLSSTRKRVLSRHHAGGKTCRMDEFVPPVDIAWRQARWAYLRGRSWSDPRNPPGPRGQGALGEKINRMIEDQAQGLRSCASS